jgi:hypothetical protein
MRIATAAFVSFMILCSASLVHADAARDFDPASLTTNNMVLAHVDDTWMNRASRTFSGGGY